MNVTKKTLAAIAVSIEMGLPVVIADEVKTSDVPNLDRLSKEVYFEPSRPFVWNSGGGVSLTIPAPKGFVSLKKGTTLAKLYENIAATDPANIVYVFWVEPKADGLATSCDAYLDELKVLRGKQITLTQFRQLTDAIPGAIANSSKVIDQVSDRMVGVLNDSLQDLGIENADFSHSGSMQLPPHRKDYDRFAFTIISTLCNGDNKMITANSCCLLWLKGHVLSFYMAEHVGDVDALSDAVKRSRRKLDDWCDAVVATNRNPIDATNVAPSR